MDYAAQSEIRILRKRFMLKQHLLSPVCLKCASFFCNDSLFCDLCYQVEIKSRLLLTENNSHIRSHFHSYLFEWNKSENDVLSQMVYRLKSNNSEPAWNFYAELAFKKLCAETDIKKYSAFVPIPGSKIFSTHALIFAQALSRISQIPVQDILCKKSGLREQKRLNAHDRHRHNSFFLRTEQLEDFTNCILVDDVLTTGGSFLQANKLLMVPENSVIMTLFYRPK